MSDLMSFILHPTSQVSLDLDLLNLSLVEYFKVIQRPL
jgi:hypothetical protein